MLLLLIKIELKNSLKNFLKCISLIYYFILYAVKIYNTNKYLILVL